MATKKNIPVEINEANEINLDSTKFEDTTNYMDSSNQKEIAADDINLVESEHESQNMPILSDEEFEKNARETRDYLFLKNNEMDKEIFQNQQAINEVLGMAKTFEIINKLGKTMRAMKFMHIKESRLYQGVQIIGNDGDIKTLNTWDDFCKSSGYSKSTINEDIQNLKTFGQEFMELSDKMGLGYRELRRMRQGMSNAVTQEDKLALEEAKTKSPEELLELLEIMQDSQESTEKRLSEIEATTQAKDELLAKRSREIDKLSMENESLKSPKNSYDPIMNSIEVLEEQSMEVLSKMHDFRLSSDIIFNDEKTSEEQRNVANRCIQKTFENLSEFINLVNGDVDFVQVMVNQGFMVDHVPADLEDSE